MLCNIRNFGSAYSFFPYYKKGHRHLHLRASDLHLRMACAIQDVHLIILLAFMSLYICINDIVPLVLVFV